MAPTGSGSRPDRWRASLVLTVTRRCNLRCAYCPTIKEGLPDLSVADALRALELFVDRYGGGEAKLFGGEPLLVPDVVEAVLRRAPPNVAVWLSTNALRLDERWIALLEERRDVTLTVSLDGAAADHDGLRRGAPSHDAVAALLPRLNRLPRFVVTQTIAPSTAARAADNFRHLRALGVTRFNLLPGYFLPWREGQLAALEASFTEIAAEFEAAWARGEKLYLRNLFVRAPTPFYNTGMVVDVDGSIHPSNVGLAMEGRVPVGTLDAPPSRAELDAAAAEVPAWLAANVAPDILAATSAADAALTRLCDRLYPAYFARKARERAA